MVADMSTETTRLIQTFSDIAASGGAVELRPGIINKTPDPHFSPGPYSWQVSCGGRVVQATWAKGVSAYDGAPCLLALATANRTTTYTVIAVPSQQPSLAGMYQVVSFTGGAGSVVVQKGGVQYTAHRASSYTPTAGDFCLCFDIEGQLYCGFPLASYSQPLPATVAPVAPTPAPPPGGSTIIPAQDSGTWTASFGGWNPYYGQDVTTGSGYIPVSTGAWFYNGGTLGLAGKNIQRIQFYVPVRLTSGDETSEIAISLYTHGNQARGGTEPTRLDGPYVFTVPPGWPGGWVDLPLSFAPTLQGGGGLSIAGDPYITLAGAGRGREGSGGQGNSGALDIDWSLV